MTDSSPNDVEKTPGPSGLLLQVKELTIRTRSGETLLSDISFHIEPGELVALTDLGRSAKSVLLQSLAGVWEPSKGEILIDGVNLYAHLKAFRPTIGYVPAEFALYQNLTVAETLRDAATLRLPRRMSSQDRKQRVQTILELVELKQVSDRRIGTLSNIEKRRLCIAMELLGYPSLLLVDESAEPLAPFDEVQITILLKDLARQGITIIYVNPRSRSAGLSDKIIYLAPGGGLVWFGPPDEGFTYLKGLLPRGVVKDLFGLQEALEMLFNPKGREGGEWAKRFANDPAYQKYVDDPLNNRYPDLLLQTRPLVRLRLRSSSKEKLPPPIVPRASGLQKFFLWVGRNFRLLWRDKAILGMLVIPPLIALLYFVLSSTQRTATPSPLVFDLFVFLVMLTSALLVQNEIFKDRALYQREQRTSSMLFPYILSKVWLVAILAVYQAFVWTILNAFTGLGTPGGLQALLSPATSLFFIAFVGGLLGLIVSALSKTAMTATGLILLLVVPQLLFLANPLSNWLILVVLGLCLIALLAIIQNRAGNVVR